MTDIDIDRPLLEETDQAARTARERYTADGVYVINLMSSPGAGKTSLLERTLERLAGQVRVGVIEGDIQGRADADRLARFQIPIHQINTHGSCHLDPRQVTAALDALGPPSLDILFIENVGNLVCPAEFDLGEHCRVMLLSVPEGHDKPGKYPLMFRTSQLLLINKIDMLEMTNFDPDEATRVATGLNPSIDVIRISCRTQVGIDEWIGWLLSGLQRHRGEV
jgi:hydrogenase nickel incorporation protein HypB